MTTEEAIQAMQRVGISIKASILVDMLERGEVQRPRMNDSAQFIWTKIEMLSAIRAFFRRKNWI